MTRFTEEDILVCADCGRTTLRRGAMQKYCPTCSAKRDRERKKKWASENPRVEDSATLKGRRQRRHELGAEASVENRASMTWATSVNEEEPLAVVRRVAVPYDKRFSKNALWSMSSDGHVFMRQEIKKVRDELIEALRDTAEMWYEGKVWIDIFVEKPDARSDAINVIDLVCDAVKKAIGVDDRWFSIRKLDWAIVKKDPRIIVGVGQSVREHHRCCSYCGKIKKLTEFGRNRSAALGHSRTCLECARVLDRERKKRE